eukprot:CAMPEP_0184656544 /NCGR_PEP_ID=MMETSP0308-20130426/16579_1 /TAXON_ID=38269 /ORGANISM="Gloeochaete witrockiana, Strain SAG 46.84" /LENGTH=319 /DNA_ID=CAMNT_0027093717 /DNA_START=64 /DNA_END=1023 /DNA_ORIENTATION=+
MRPIALKGHERPITFLKYNREGDLLFSCSKDDKATVWYSIDGERLGTYNGHNGAIWCLDVNWFTTRLITASADNTAKIWDVETGKALFNFQFNCPIRSVAFNHGDKLFTLVSQQFMQVPAAIKIYAMAEDIEDQTDKPLREIQGHEGNINHVLWGPLNKYLLSAGDDSTMKIWDPETGKHLHTIKDHTKSVNSIAFAKDESCFISSSSDNTAKLFDSKTFKCLKTYRTDRPINAAAISPLMDHVILGGGQEASQVTTTSSRVGGFATRLFHKVYEEEIGSIKGHFGPINALAFHPSGKSFASGSEDGYVRIHYFDPDYF